MTPPFTSQQNQVWITDVATVTALGDDLEKTWRRLLESRTAIRPVVRFNTGAFTSGVAACMEDLPATGCGSMVRFLLARLARGLGPVPGDAGLVTATAKAGIDSLEKSQRGTSCRAEDLLPAFFPRMVSEAFGLKRPGINISAACASSTIAVSQASAMIHAGAADVVLMVSADLVSEFVFSGFSSLGALAATPCRPFDRNRSGLSLGEGAVALLLMNSKRAEAEGRIPLGRVHGWGAANDAFHVTAPAPDGSGLSQAIRQALKCAGLEKEAIGAVCAHGTGTVSNDAMELRALRDCFGGPAGVQLPVFSVKGAIGHTLGPAGGIEVALGLKVLSQQVVPPTVGFSHPADGAQGWVFAEPVPVRGDYLLSSNSGFGGINAALVLGKGA